MARRPQGYRSEMRAAIDEMSDYMYKPIGRAEPMDMAMMLAISPADWAAALASRDRREVRATLGTALKFKCSTQRLVQFLGADTVRAATVRGCLPGN